jgi:hypothetical protein
MKRWQKIVLIWLAVVVVGYFAGYKGIKNIYDHQKYNESRTFLVAWPGHGPVTVVGFDPFYAPLPCGLCFMDTDGVNYTCVTNAVVKEIKAR